MAYTIRGEMVQEKFSAGRGFIVKEIKMRIYTLKVQFILDITVRNV
jgi:hypothetical protein